MVMVVVVVTTMLRKEDEDEDEDNDNGTVKPQQCKFMGFVEWDILHTQN
jgi:hypothetical protein